MKNINSKGIGVIVAAIFFGMSTCHAAEIDSATEVVDIANTVENIDTEKFLARLIDTNGGKFLNLATVTSDNPAAVGVNVRGSNSIVIQRGDIFLTGDKAVGILIGGGRVLNVDSQVIAAGNAVEFTGDKLFEEFNLAGRLQGGDHAIFIGTNSAVRNINISAGSQIVGNIVSNSAQATNLNFNADISYGGNIIGANNINLHITGGTLNFSGAADVSSVDIANGAKIFGGTFTVAKFINHGTIGAGSPDTNLVINGELISDGFIKKISGGSQGLIVVHGHANVDGSTVTTDSLLPNETATVLVADSISGKIKNPAGKPVPISAMLNATGSIVGNKLTVTTYAADNLGKLNAQEKETFDAMNNMFGKLDDTKQAEMRDLYNLPTVEAKQTLTQISSNDSAQIMSVAQQSTAVDRMIANRITHIFAPEYLDVTVRPMNFSDDDSSAVTVNVKVPVRQENNFWLNFMKNWGKLRGGTDYHGSVIVGGYDRSIGDKWRAGIFATYGTIGYGANSSRATVYDTRLGLYAGWHNRASDVYFYVNGGQLRNSLHRSLSSLGLSTNANYKSRIVEIGGEYKYDLQPNRTWHVSPFVNVQASHIRQDSYHERGAGIYNQHIGATGNTYFAAQAGLDLKRFYRTGMLGMRLGVKHGFTGVDPELNISYEGDGARSYRLRQQRDKTHFVFSVRGENEFARGWFVGGEAELQLGENDRDVTASLMLRRTW